MTLPFPLQTRARFHLVSTRTEGSQFVSKSVSHSFPTRFPLPSSRLETGNGVLGSTFLARTVRPACLADFLRTRIPSKSHEASLEGRLGGLRGSGEPSEGKAALAVKDGKREVYAFRAGE
jgi:hypothetical protein